MANAISSPRKKKFTETEKENTRLLALMSKGKLTKEIKIVTM